MTSASKRLLVGTRMRSDQLSETELPKRLALPVFGSDAISSNAYATQEILLVLALGGAAAVALTPTIALVVVGLLAIITLSYRQTCYAYPNGGGAYAVSKENLGTKASLIAAAALLVDYVMTVAVSIAAGVENFTSAFPAVHPYTVPLCLAMVAGVTLMNLRGVKESGTFFAIPTYGFLISVFVMLGVGAFRSFMGRTPVAESADFGYSAASTTGAALLILLLRAFASGCTALTGTEAISNGVPTFRKPKSHNAATTLMAMAGLAISMMIGIALLSNAAGIHIAEHPDGLTGTPEGYVQRTVLAQLSASVFGNNTVGFFAVQMSTTLILILAANTAFNGFPILASQLGQDRFLPKQMRRRGDRLVFSNGILILASVAGTLIYLFDGSVSKLIQLYILGVFVSFTLSQSGMVVHWWRDAQANGWGRRNVASMVINLVGAAATALVLVIVLMTKFSHGAWMVVVAIPALVMIMMRIHRHYVRVSRELRPKATGITLPSRIHAVVLVSQLNEPTLKALALAQAGHPNSITALRVDTDHARTDTLVEDWDERQIPIPLAMVASPFRDLIGPVVDYLVAMQVGPRDVVEVFVPEYVVGHWWEHVLHNQSALRLKSRLLFMPGVIVTSVPYHLTSAAQYSLPPAGAEAVQPEPPTQSPVTPAEPAAPHRHQAAEAPTTDNAKVLVGR
ncbi:MAG TPA: APC family permease [Propionibacteriaceae bacterium]|nr:APC family permease [Propionibacteriaceae bacterium]